MISFESKGNFKTTEKFLKTVTKGDIYRSLERYAQQGVAALSAATPIDSGVTRTLWAYRIKRSNGVYSITWTNAHVINGVPIAIILQYGHGTGNGGYIQGRDYINPTMKPIFDNISNNVWKAVNSA